MFSYKIRLSNGDVMVGSVSLGDSPREVTMQNAREETIKVL